MISETLKWVGTACIALAQWLLFSKSTHLWVSTILFPMGSLCWLYGAVVMKDKALIVVNVIMIAFGLFGIYNWFLS